MRSCLWTPLFFVALTATPLLLSQSQSGELPSKGIPPNQRLESRQGYPDKSDVIAHTKLPRGTHLFCADVEHHSKHGDGVAACVLKFEDDETQTLTFQQQTQTTKDGDVALGCSGDKPTRCTIWWWRD